MCTVATIVQKLNYPSVNLETAGLQIISINEQNFLWDWSVVSMSVTSTDCTLIICITLKVGSGKHTKNELKLIHRKQCEHNIQ